MKRSPVVVAATIAGTAGVLAFHPHAPAVQAAAATTKTSSASTTATASASTTATPSSGTGSSASSVSGTATGESVATQYGNAQVKVTVANGKITKVEALALQGNDPRSVQISSGAEPILQEEVLGKQTADVDAVSGATFTSASYLQSVQSALDKLGFKAPDGSVATLQVP